MESTAATSTRTELKSARLQPHPFLSFAPATPAPAPAAVATAAAVTPDGSAVCRQRQREKDTATAAKGTGVLSVLSPIEKPLQHDVICGRDKFCQAHSGNQRFRVMIAMNREQYQTARSRDDKTRIATEVIGLIQSSRPGGRFLKQDAPTGLWCIVTDEYARAKVCHALRSAKDPNKSKPKKKRKSFVLKKVVYTERENKIYHALLSDQLSIFKNLVSNHDGDVMNDTQNSRSIEGADRQEAHTDRRSSDASVATIPGRSNDNCSQIGENSQGGEYQEDSSENH